MAGFDQSARDRIADALVDDRLGALGVDAGGVRGSLRPHLENQGIDHCMNTAASIL